MIIDMKNLHDYADDLASYLANRLPTTSQYLRYDLNNLICRYMEELLGVGFEDEYER